MFSKSSLKKARHNLGSRFRNSVRCLAMEPLEDRSLLSVLLGLPAGPVSNSTPAVVGPAVSGQGVLLGLPVGPVSNPTPAVVGSAVSGQGGVTAIVATQLAMSLPQNVPNGVPVPVELAAEDASGQVAPNYSGTVTLTSTDPNVVLPKTITFHHGVAIFPVTFKTAGPQSLTATDDSTPALSVTASTTVAAPIVATQLAMSLPQNVPNGVPVPVELAAEDASGRLVSDYSGTITLTSTDPNIVLPKTITFHYGVAVFQVTFKTAGPQSLTATDNSTPALSVTANTTVAAPIVATQLAMHLPKDVPNGVPVPVELVAKDASGRLVPNYSGTITLTSTDPNVVLPKTITFDHGVAIFPVTFKMAGPQSLTATDNSTPALSVTANTTVAAPIVATQLAMHLPKNVPNGVPVPVELTARDASGRLVPNYSGTITLTSTDPNVVLPKTITFDHGVAIFPVTFKTAGPQSLTATDNSTPALSVTVSTTVAAPLVATQLAMHMPQNAPKGVPVPVELVAEDASGHLVPNYSGTITLTSTDPNVVLPKTITFVDGVAIFEVTFNTAGPQSLTATDDSATPLTVTVKITVVPRRP